MPHSLAELLFAVGRSIRGGLVRLPPCIHLTHTGTAQSLARPRTAPVAEISACLAGTTSAGRKFVFSDYSGSIRREGAATAPVTANWPSAGRRSRRVPLTRRASRQSRPNAVRLQIRCRAAALIVEPRLRPDRLVIIREEQRLHSFCRASNKRTRKRGQPRSSDVLAYGRAAPEHAYVPRQKVPAVLLRRSREREGTLPCSRQPALLRAFQTSSLY